MTRRIGLPIVLGVLFSVLVAGTAAGQSSAGTISWQVKDRFRLFGDNQPPEVEQLLDILATPHDEKTVYQKIVDTLVIKKELANKGDGVAEYIHAHLPVLYRSTSLQSADLVNLPRLKAFYAADYLTPQHYWISAQLDAPGSGQRCKWALAGQPLVTQDCALPIEFKITADARGGHAEAEALEVVREVDGARTSATITVHDFLILGIGDSFGSGEGNPDEPVVWGTQRVGDGSELAGAGVKSPTWFADSLLPLLHTRIRSSLVENDLNPFWEHPRKGPLWVDTPCHRSLLNDQVIAGLRLASTRPHDAVTLVHLACTGAEIFNGLISAQFGGAAKGQLQAFEDLRCAGRQYRPQRSAPFPLPNPSRWLDEHHDVAVKDNSLALCANPSRDVDAVFLSIGGNDAGFAGAVAWAILPSEARFDNSLGGQWRQIATTLANGGAICPNDKMPYRNDPKDRHPHKFDPRCENKKHHSVEAYIGSLPTAYASLDAAFRDLGISPSKVIHMSYPDPSLLANSDLGYANFAKYYGSSAATKLYGVVAEAHYKDAGGLKYRNKVGITNPPREQFCPGASVVTRTYTEAEPAGSGHYTPGLDGFRGVLATFAEGTDRRVTVDQDRSYIVETKVVQPLLAKLATVDAAEHWVATQPDDIWRDIKTRGGWCSAADVNSEENTLRTSIWSNAGATAPYAYDYDTVRLFRTPNDSIFVQYNTIKDSILATMHPTLLAHVKMSMILSAKADAVISLTH